MNHMRFEIHRGRELNGQLVNMRLAGYAFQNEGENYYRVKLMLLPDNVYYLSKNQGHGYTLFSKAATDDQGRVTFQNPVGFAKVLDHIRTHIYVRFADLQSHMFMSLYPSGKASAV